MYGNGAVTGSVIIRPRRKPIRQEQISGHSGFIEAVAGAMMHIAADLLFVTAELPCSVMITWVFGL